MGSGSQSANVAGLKFSVIPSYHCLHISRPFFCALSMTRWETCEHITLTIGCNVSSTGRETQQALLSD